ncbi:GDSL esterase/lipase At5g03600-like [Miscanthus floridulus]|uniref:GDSL esterase/lipase At5g03600-like n=1 Tax=Miscanthus floridulus TaxID=154761 RepID=UPI00345950D3
MGLNPTLVSTLPPIGCTPWLSRSSDYSSSCDSQKVASIHNAYLEEKSEYCGQMEDGVAAYSLCSTPDKYFYWDDINPTHAGWKAVVKELEESIRNFL